MESVKLNMNKDFRRLYGRGQSHAGATLVTYVMHNKRNKVRYGITVSKKIGCAVQRNRARRVIEAAMQECMKEIDCSGVDIVFVARTRTPAAKSGDVAAVMRKHLLAEGIIPSFDK